MVLSADSRLKESEKQQELAEGPPSPPLLSHSPPPHACNLVSCPTDMDATFDPSSHSDSPIVKAHRKKKSKSSRKHGGVAQRYAPPGTF